MQYELIADRYAEQLEGEIIEEAFPLVAVALTSLLGYVGYKTYKAGGIDPDWQKLADESTWYNVISIFDPTGIMSWPYVPAAWDRYEKEDSWWNGFLFLLACLSTVPVMGLGAKAVTKLVLSPVLVPAWILLAIKKAVTGIGSALGRNNKITERVLPDIIAKASATTYKGKNLGDTMRKSFDKTMGLKTTDEAIEASAKRMGIKLPSRMGRVAQKSWDLLKKGGRIARTATAIAAVQDNKTASDIQRAFNTPRTPAVQGPKVGFGQIGGRVQYGPPN